MIVCSMHCVDALKKARPLAHCPSPHKHNEVSLLLTTAYCGNKVGCCPAFQALETQKPSTILHLEPTFIWVPPRLDSHSGQVGMVQVVM